MLHQIRICIFIYLNVFKIMDPFIHFGYTPSKGTMVYLETNLQTIELQLLQHFLRDNSHLDLLSRAENMPLATEFRDVVCGHAFQFQSTSELVIVQNDHTFQLPGKYTLTALDSNEVHFIQAVYAYLYLHTFLMKRMHVLQHVRNIHTYCCLERSSLQLVKEWEERFLMLLLCQ